jgi:hypothetical protein
MKKFYNIFILTIIMFIFAFAGCDNDGNNNDDDDDDYPSALGETVTMANLQAYDLQGSEIATTYTFTKYSVTYTLADVGLENISIASNGKFTLNLKKPTKLNLLNFGNNVKVDPSNAKGILITSFVTANDKQTLYYADATMDNIICYAYVDKNVTLTGTGDDEYKYNLKLKEGWSTVINNITAKTLTSGSPDNSYKWLLFDDDE